MVGAAGAVGRGAPERRPGQYRPAMDAPARLAARPADHLEAGDLVLRAWRPEDGPALLEAVLESLEELHPWMPWAHRAYGPEDAQGFIEEAVRARATGAAFPYAVVSAGVLAGACGLHPREDPPRLEIGYWTHSAMTGRGLATRSAAALATEALARPEVACVEIRHDRENRRSAHVPRRLGFEHVARRAREPRAPGESDTEWVWRLAHPPRVDVGPLPRPPARTDADPATG